VTKVNFQPNLGQGSLLKEFPSPLTDLMEWYAAVNHPAAMSAEKWLAHTAMTSGWDDSVNWSLCLLGYGRFDFNEMLGKGSSFMKTKDWQVILPIWEDFIGNEFSKPPDLFRGACYKLG
jgi:hypothetical protein